MVFFFGKVIKISKQWLFYLLKLLLKQKTTSFCMPIFFNTRQTTWNVRKKV